jgi:uncharacterized protein YjbI with pentapeptide repeats
MPQDFSGKNLRGRNFKGQNLTGAKFIGADIRGANFTNAILTEADFTGAKAGLQRHWTIFIVTISLFLSLISGFMSGFASSWIAVFFILNIIKQYTIISAVLMLIVLALFFIDTIRQGLRAVAVAVAVAGAVAGADTVAAVMAGAGVAAGAVAGSGAMSATGAATAIAGAATAIGIYLACWDALAGEEKYAWIHTTAIAIAATGGTSFRNADLTDANFTEATLKSTDFRTANLTRTCFRYTKKLDRARVGESILADTRIRELLVTGNGSTKSYVGANFQGANLNYADLSYANLKRANLSEATLHQANLEWANLTETKALATDFTAASFTGACLEAWNIGANTKLDRIDCRFIYLLEYPKPGTNDRDRRPSSGEFASGDFTKLFEEVLNTIDLIFRNGIDSKAFVAAFKQLQVKNEGTELTIQSIENKGDGFIVVKVNVPPDANKEHIHENFTQSYYQAQLKAKDAQIETYREEIAFLRELNIKLAKNPIVINSSQDNKPE